MQDFWSTPSAGALITGTIGLGVAIVGYLGTRENTRRQLDAERSRWRNDSILREVRDYLAAARALVYLVAGRQVDLTPDDTEKK